MALFGGNNTNSGATAETTIISAGAKIGGEFDFDSKLHIDGELNGTIRSKSEVVIGKGGAVRGKLSAKKVVINGVFEGELKADSLEVLAGGVLDGDIEVEQLGIENGGKFNGTSKMAIEKVDSIDSFVGPKPLGAGGSSGGGSSSSAGGSADKANKKHNDKDDKDEKK